MTDKGAMKLARQIIWRYRHETPLGNQPHMIAHEADEAIEKIDQALNQEQGEPVLWAAKESMFMWGNSDESGHPYHIICKGKKVKSHQIPLYTTPQQRTWVGLTDEELKGQDEAAIARVRYWEAKLKEKNT